LCESRAVQDFDLKSSLNCGSLAPVVPPKRSSQPAIIPLSRLPTGIEARVLRIEGEAGVCQRLREIGFCESAIICRVGSEHMLVCQVCGTRVALHQGIGEQIHVEPLGRTA
jgi:ferrous iron transport protein A